MDFEGAVGGVGREQWRRGLGQGGREDLLETAGGRAPAVRADEGGISLGGVIERVPELELARDTLELWWRGRACGRQQEPSQSCSEGSWADQALHVFCLWKFCPERILCGKTGGLNGGLISVGFVSVWLWQPYWAAEMNWKPEVQAESEV